MFVAIYPCYEPVYRYNIIHGHIPLAVDIITVGECLLVFFALIWCGKSVTALDIILFCIGMTGCLLGLVSSIGGLAEMTGKIVGVGHWGWGLAGFVTATVPRGKVIRLLIRSGNLLNRLAMKAGSFTIFFYSSGL